MLPRSFACIGCRISGKLIVISADLRSVLLCRRAFSNICQLLKPGGDCLVSMLAQIPLFDAYELMSQSSKWMKYMQDVNEFVSPYQKAEDPGALAETFLKSFHGSYKVHVRERVFVYNDVNALRGKL